MNIPSVTLSENELLIRTSNRITHESPGALSKPCGFYAEVLEENNTVDPESFPVIAWSLESRGRDLQGEGSVSLEGLERSSIAGSPEARARKKLVKEKAETIAKRNHGIYTHRYHKETVEQFEVLEWFRMDNSSARRYLEGGVPSLLGRCREMKHVLEESLPEPADVYDYVPDGYGIKSIYNEIYRMLKKEMLKASTDLDSALASARLNDKLVVNTSDFSYKQGEALGLDRGESEVNLHKVFRNRCKALLDPLREIIPIAESWNKIKDER